MALLSEEEVDAGLSELSGWHRDGDAIVRDVKVADFAAALALVNAAGAIAEEDNHHPDLLIHGWNRVRLTLSTHSEGGITASDLAMAQRLETAVPAEAA